MQIFRWHLNCKQSHFLTFCETNLSQGFYVKQELGFSRFSSQSKFNTRNYNKRHNFLSLSPTFSFWMAFPFFGLFDLLLFVIKYLTLMNNTVFINYWRLSPKIITAINICKVQFYIWSKKTILISFYVSMVTILKKN